MHKKAIVRQKTYDVIKATKKNPSAFANIVTEEEITSIVDETNVQEEDVIETEKGWKLITFDVKQDFSVVGFIAKIANKLATKGISILPIAGFKRSYISERKTNYANQRKALEEDSWTINVE